MPAKFALDLTPDKAIEFLESKKAFAKHLDEPALRDSARARASRIANLSSLQMTSNIYESMAEGKRNKQPYNAWVKDVMAMLERKGWITGYDKQRKEYVIADPKTGEYFGPPRRLETIYRTNMQAAFSAQTYQQLMDNVDNRPYWQYSAILDNRTRPRHASMHGLIFRYDDPFWTTFYPPNGFNCRCTVNALKERDLERKELVVSDGSKLLDEVEIEPKKGVKQKTIGLKMADETVLTTDSGFDYNVGRRAYKPNLDLYPEKLAHQFAKAEMSGFEFKQVYQQLEKEAAQAFEDKKRLLGIKTKKVSEGVSKEVQEALRLEYKFAAGIVNEYDAQLLGLKTRTVWLSDSTLVKQFNSRAGDKNFDYKDYLALPELINNADHIYTEGNDFTFVKRFGESDLSLLLVIKFIPKTQELFVASLRGVGDVEWKKLAKNKTVIR
ncbi:phage minor head protein [Glaesserella parasuis]|uniref:phage minor head protein n=1 Tax=Glaesserella parasuis TaxID=738 RepID=UPI001326A747|nr:phage head morphogenesis protein [Glaesserella parasuis]MWQ83293.1 phage head morphogenesis protein [Glaesserella parasuis]